jgi:hypothetical protein
MASDEQDLMRERHSDAADPIAIPARPGPPELAQIGWQIAFGIVLLLLIVSLVHQARPEWFKRSSDARRAEPRGSAVQAVEPAASAPLPKPRRPDLEV